uniref:M20_dimer domain-containing protein n=1 Tax=Haemonchus contortus TaxID=6289 RepID=A0A7I4Y074_HAECO
MVIGGSAAENYNLPQAALETILSMAQRPNWPTETRRLHIEQPLRDLVTAINWEKHVRERHKARKLHLNKRLWLELLRWRDVEKMLESEPKLKGFGFQKNEIAVRPQLLAANPEHSFTSRCVLGQFDISYRVHQWAYLGYNACEEVVRRRARSLVIGNNTHVGICVGADFKDFNACHRLRDMANDYSLMERFFTNMWYQKGSETAAVSDWRKCCHWLEEAAQNCWMELEDGRGEERVTVGLFSGIQDTNGTNERRHIVEVARAFRELELYGLLPVGTESHTHIDLRGDDSIIVSPSAANSALLFTALCASGKPMEAVKQEIWSDQCEYLRNKVTAFRCQGYLNRNIGTLISAPFENADRHDVVGRLEAICQQIATIHRRGANTRNCRALQRIMVSYSGRYKRNPEAEACGVNQMWMLPVEVLYGTKADGGLDCNLLSDTQIHLKDKLPPVPRFNKASTRITKDIEVLVRKIKEYDHSRVTIEELTITRIQLETKR